MVACFPSPSHLHLSAHELFFSPFTTSHTCKLSNAFSKLSRIFWAAALMCFGVYDAFTVLLTGSLRFIITWIWLTDVWPSLFVCLVNMVFIMWNYWHRRTSPLGYIKLDAEKRKCTESHPITWENTISPSVHQSNVQDIVTLCSGPIFFSKIWNGWISQMQTCKTS